MKTFNPKACSAAELLAVHSAVLDELCARNVLRSRNNPTGDYAEWLVADKLSLTLAPKSSKGFDATDAYGKRFQIKGRRADPKLQAPLLGTIRDFDTGNFDYLVAVVFNLDWGVRSAAKIAHADLGDLLKFRKHVNGHDMRLGSSIFRNYRVSDITNVLRGAMANP